MTHNHTLNHTNTPSETDAAKMTAIFLKKIQKVSSRLNNYKAELARIAGSVARLERTGMAANFSDQFWKLSGYQRFAEIQIERLSALLGPALLTYPNRQNQVAIFGDIQFQTARTESVFREMRLFWRELSATYHFMLGINGLLIQSDKCS